MKEGRLHSAPANRQPQLCSDQQDSSAGAVEGRRLPCKVRDTNLWSCFSLKQQDEEFQAAIFDTKDAIISCPLCCAFVPVLFPKEIFKGEL